MPTFTRKTQKPELWWMLGIIVVALAAGLLVPQAASPALTTLANVSSTGVPGKGSSFNPALSADGRFVAFESTAALVPEDSFERFSDVFVHDRLTGTAERVSVSSFGRAGHQSSSNPALSADGRFVAFHSDASNLVLGDTNEAPDVFLHDRVTGITIRVSVANTGAQGNDASFHTALSADGGVVAFASRARNLAWGDRRRTDVFVHDRQGVVVAICRGYAVTIVGTDGDDTIRGTEGADVIHGFDGNDRIEGLGGRDLICGGPGDDILHGGDGDDTLVGEDGDDLLHGGAGHDRLRGARGTTRSPGTPARTSATATATPIPRSTASRSVKSPEAGPCNNRHRRSPCEDEAITPVHGRQARNRAATSTIPALTGRGGRAAI